MKIWQRLRKRLASLRGSDAFESDLRRELESHLELEAEEQLESGAAPEEARDAAHRIFGNSARVAEDVRESRSLQWLENFLRDVRYGVRSLRKSPGFTAVAVLTLALGIGANTAIFSVMNALILEPLPFPAADRLVRILSTKNGALIMGYASPGGPSGPDLQDFAKSSHTLEKIVAYDMWPKNVSSADAASEPEQMGIGLIPPGYFEILDMAPLMGRPFTEEEARASKPPNVAAISTRIWRSRFGGDKSILSRKITINDEPYSIVAVMPDIIPDWTERGAPEIWTPASFMDGLSESDRGARGITVLAKLKPGVSVKQAQADLSTIAANLAATHPVDDGVGVIVRRLIDTRAGPMRPMLFLLTGAVALILLIACVNLANLLLARNSARQQELALRAALGSGRRGLIRLLLAETLVLSLAGGAAGLLLAYAGLVSLARIHPADLPQLAAIKLDARVLAFTFAISLVTSLLFGLAPALTDTRLNLADALKQGGRSGTAGRSAQRVRNILVVTEMAMSLMLLISAGLLVQSIMHLEHQDLGVRADYLVKGHIYLAKIRYPNPDSITRFSDEFGARVRAIPGVQDASITTLFPPYNGWSQMLGIAGNSATRIQDIPQAQFGVTDSHFLATMGIPLLRGRDFAASDTATTAPVALISRELQRRYFATQDPLGQKIHIGPPKFLQMPVGEDTTDSSDVTVIGVIGDIRNVGLALPPEPQILVLYSQHPLVNYGFKDLLVRTTSDPLYALPEIRRQLHQMDSDIPLAAVQTMDDLVAKQIGSQRFTTALLASFALAGLALAVVGIYGVISYLVARRMQEFGVRVALGASSANILSLVVRQGMSMALVGAAIGLFGAYAARQFIGGLLFGISPADPLTFLAAACFLLAIAAIACAIPGARVMYIDPSRILRQG
jgi:predicted permease